MKYGREDEELRDTWRREQGEMRDEREKRARCETKQREGGRLMMKEREGGDGRLGREEADIRESTRKSEVNEI